MSTLFAWKLADLFINRLFLRISQQVRPSKVRAESFAGRGRVGAVDDDLSNMDAEPCSIRLGAASVSLWELYVNSTPTDMS
jgi:hypothetical protein